MSKAGRNKRRVAAALRPTTTVTRDVHAGVNLDPAADLDPDGVRQPVSINVESSAVHSASLGWIPAMFITIDHVALVGSPEPATFKLMLLGYETMLEHIQTLNVALDRAVLDAQVGFRLE